MKDGVWINPHTDPAVLSALHAVFEGKNAELRAKHKDDPRTLAIHNNFPTVPLSEMIASAQANRRNQVAKTLVPGRKAA